MEGPPTHDGDKPRPVALNRVIQFSKLLSARFNLSRHLTHVESIGKLVPSLQKLETFIYRFKLWLNVVFCSRYFEMISEKLK